METKNIRFSLICPSRERPQKLINFLTSVEKTAFDKGSIEVIVVSDDDDPATFQAVDRFKASFSIVNHQRRRSDWLNNDYYNYAAGFARGEFIWCVGDDVIFETPEWDRIILKAMAGYTINRPDGIVLIKTNNSTPLPTKFANPVSFCCFPVFSRAGFNAMGFLFPPSLATWGADIAIYRLYLAVDRILDLSSEICLDHISHHNGKDVRDKVSLSMEERTKRLGGEPRYAREKLNEDIERLKRFIK